MKKTGRRTIGLALFLLTAALFAACVDTDEPTGPAPNPPDEPGEFRGLQADSARSVRR